MTDVSGMSRRGTFPPSTARGCSNASATINAWRWRGSKGDEGRFAGIVGALVIANWSYGLVRNTGAILLDMTSDRNVQDGIRRAVENEGDRLADLHVWRLGPGHLGAILSVVTGQPRDASYYRDLLTPFPSLSHITVEVRRTS